MGLFSYYIAKYAIVSKLVNAKPLLIYALTIAGKTIIKKTQLYSASTFKLPTIHYNETQNLRL